MSYHTGNHMGSSYRRNGTRFDYEQDCTLVHNGAKYLCRMRNISISGVLVSLSEQTVSGIQPGDTCRLSLCTGLVGDSGEYVGSVSRLSQHDIALNFTRFIY
ncbi:MAG: PilZ domain-containing protein [Desulfuromonadaceae bacterium]|nr:PilZ domain-containing protein [Desulfuromonadaceae bacterium]MDD5104724.1 PilZ domain-containing protein [Desulfuromonadaceae bacterium]